VENGGTGAVPVTVPVLGDIEVTVVVVWE